MLLLHSDRPEVWRLNCNDQKFFFFPFATNRPCLSFLPWRLPASQPPAVDVGTITLANRLPSKGVKLMAGGITELKPLGIPILLVVLLAAGWCSA